MPNRVARQVPSMLKPTHRALGVGGLTNKQPQSETRRMKAATYRRYGPPSVVTVRDWPDPVPAPGEVLVRIEAAGLTSGDARIRAARAPGGLGLFLRLAFGVTRPRRPILGREYAGRIAACGANVTRFSVGDAVFGITDGMTLGAHADYVAVKADGLLYSRPDSLPPIEAATFFFGGLTAADFLLDQCSLQPGERLLIVGGTGAVGSAAIQIARHSGAHVTALTHADNLQLARDLGAHEALDYRIACELSGYNVILDVPGVMPQALNALAPGGRLGLVTATFGQMIRAALRPNQTNQRRLCASVIQETPQAIARLIELHRVGGYRPLVGESFPLAEIHHAHARADSGHKRGNLAVLMETLPPQDAPYAP
ncbi:NAD(P)-dependent alcohol dehydrogenase [Elstera litoralis]|nr:NAD(P)-dependent alcohol dehydrogenase [Elstera litoralis]